MNLRLIALPSALILGATASLAPAAALNIPEAAPPDSFLVVSVPDWSRMKGSMDNTGIGAFLREPQAKKLMDRLFKETYESLDAELKKVNATREEIGYPSGAAGVAMWWGANPDTKAFTSRWLAGAEYGERAEDVADIIVEMIEQAQKDGQIEIVEEERDDVTIYVITTLVPEPDEDEEGDEEFDDFEDEDNGGLFGELTGVNPKDPGRMLFARREQTLCLASDMGAMERLFDALRGDEMNSVADESDYAAALAQMGEVQASAVLMVKPLLDRLLRMDDDGEGLSVFAMLPGDLAPMLDAIGLNECRAMSAGLRFDSGGVMLDVVGGLLAPTKKGLLALFDAPGDSLDAPPFVGADAVSLTNVRVKFSEIPAFLQGVANAAPEEERAQAQASIGLMLAAISPLLPVIGPDVVLTQSLTRPFSPTSEKQVVAVRNSNPQTVSAMLTQYAPMIGLAARDFDGNEIWSAPPGTEGAPAIGLGFGYAFAGEPEVVENSMRLAGRPDAPRLNDEPRFKRAMRTLEPGASVFAYSELGPALEHALWQMRHLPEIVRQEIESSLAESDVPPEEREEIIRSYVEDAEPPDWIEDLPPLEVFTRHLGDWATEVRPTQEGFRFRYRWLPPAN